MEKLNTNSQRGFRNVSAALKAKSKGLKKKQKPSKTDAERLAEKLYKEIKLAWH